MKTTSAYFTTSDGVKLHYLEVGRGRPLVLFAGVDTAGRGLLRQRASLSDSFRCLAIDFRGHGKSERPNFGYRVSRLARDCWDFFEHLGLKDLVLLGHSAGCVVIWSLIDLFGDDRVRALVLSDQPIAFVKRPGWWPRLNVATMEHPSQGTRCWLRRRPSPGRTERTYCAASSPVSSAQGFPRSNSHRVIEGSLKMPRGAAAELMLSVMQADFRDLLPRIRRPVLCIGGTRSHLGPRAMPWIAAQIPPCKARHD